MLSESSKAGLIVDLFAGGGGASTGIEAALGRPVDLAINHSAVALAVHEANHPRTRHLTADLFEVDPRVATRGRRVDVLWASPDCTHHSRAKGGKPRDQKIRSLAHVVVEWARAVRPRVIFVENVQEFLEWGPLGADGLPIKSRKGESFGFWRGALELLGYRVEHRILDASLYGAPTRRRRLFIVARCDGEAITWPDPTHGPGRLPLRTAAECIDWSLPCPSIFERKRPLAEKTLWRIAQGIRRYVIDNPQPFIVQHDGERWAPTLVQTGYGERPGQAARALDLHEPLGTVVAGGQKHALAYALLKHYGGVVGQPLEAPTSTITATDHHGLAAVTLAKFRGTDPSQPGSCPVDAPLPTISAGGVHVAEVRAFLTAYYGSDATGGQSLRDPLRTITAKHRLGLVTVAGGDFQIVDIGMRMLQPHELLKAQFGGFADGYDLSAARTKAAQIRLIGNSVCPDVVEALVRSNLKRREVQAA